MESSRTFEEIAEPVAQSFDESGMSEEELDELIEQARAAAREERGRREL
jgi:hypothetical protein